MIEFDWLIHYKCNYRCPYCFFEGMWEEVERRNHYIPHERWIEAWRRIHAKYGAFNLIITGGEPFLYPGFLELLTALNGIAHVSFDTNFSCPKETVAEVAKRMDPQRIFMGLSFHPVFAKLDEFVEKALLLKERGFNFRVHYVTYPDQLDGLKKARDIFMGHDFRFTPIPFRGTYKGKPYPASFTESEKETIYGVTTTIAKCDRDWAEPQVEQVKSRDQVCRAGQLYARVDNDGTVYPCGNDYTKSKEKYVLGNILEPSFALRGEPMVCRQETCPCEFRWIVKEGEK